MATKKDEEKKEAAPSLAGKKVELADKDTGFYDAATGFKVVRDQKVELGDVIGEKTNVALASGRLLLVGKGKGKAEPEAVEEEK